MKQKILLFSEQILLYSKFQYIEWAHLLTILYIIVLQNELRVQVDILWEKL